MNKRSVISYLRFFTTVITSVVLFSAFFSLGFLIIMKIEQSTNSQLEGIGKDMLKNEERSVSAHVITDQPGAGITDMEKHVGALQRNLDTTKKVQAATGGS